MHHDTTSTSRRTLTAFYDRREDANEAVERLVSAGVTRSDINLVEGSGSSTSSSASTSGRSYPDEGMGFWDALKDLFLPDEDRSTYSEGLRRGGHLLTVRVNDALYDRALDIMDDEGTVDLDQRQESWRSEGWTPSMPSIASGASGGMGSSSAGSSYASSTEGTGLMGGSSAAGTAGYAGSVRGETSSTHTSSGSSTSGMTGTGSDYAARGSSERDEVIPVAEEHLRVGKREVAGGRVRVRSYVVETPVQEQVNLREEHVHIDRRPVDRALTGDEKLFQDRTIDVEERSEEAVVSKEARVKEELHIRKDAENRTQTVSDTVRRTEVEVEDERTGRGLTGTTDRDR